MLARIWKVLLGLLLLGIGGLSGFVPLLPGWPVGFVGLALVLSQSTPGRRVLTRIRLWARGRIGSERVRALEARLPDDVISPQDTTQMRLDLEAYARERAARRAQVQGGRRGRRRS